MTLQDRQIQLQDLCARVPYHPKGHVVNSCNGAECDEWLTCETFTMFTNIMNNTRLYLRPMSSMTEEEQKEFAKFHCVNICPIVITEKLTISNETEMFDWLNKKMFDYRGLIERNLAIDCSNLNIYD